MLFVRSLESLNFVQRSSQVLIGVSFIHIKLIMNIIFFIILNDLLFNDHIAYASVEQKGANQDFIRIICNDTLLLSKERLSMKIVNTYFKKNDIEIFYKSNIFLVIYYLFFKIPNEHDNCLIDDIRCHIIFSIFLF